MAAATNRMKEMSWTTFLERKRQTDLVIIPTGACEVYGPHLPMGSDMLVAAKLAELVAGRVHAIIGPTLEVGDSSALDDFPGTITITPDSFKAYLKDVVDSLIKWGFKNFLFINGHAGNVAMVNHVSQTLRQRPELRCAQIDCWRFIKAQDQGIVESGEVAHGHAGEAGTSVLLYLYPELVDLEQAVDEVPKQKDLFPEVIKYARYGTKTESGTIGYPSLASREKGEALVQRSVDRIARFLHETWNVSYK
ncbi:creatininase family protein [Brevibacillus choshinensis]|uniref:Creatininase family protein n=1 Tax=Brevibacillus choshinensis TaxID=54911 RepID=A0ABX7FGH7_BRECH|nr:creatininase family protein [Brevibacillus choshinensis]QRG65141.1 creatininase family protein [Brevibacillus choshinensis]